MKFTENHTLEQILESAIVASWEDLTNGTEPVLIHVEYNLTACGTVDDLRIWSSIVRGHDDLLTVTRGLRNSATHFEAADHSVYGIIVYLTKFLFEAFVAAWIRHFPVPAPRVRTAAA
jgi:hypothetical protein